MSMKLGERLVNAAMVDKEQIKQALDIQKRTGDRLGDILLAITSMRALDYYQVLAKHYDIPFINLLRSPAEESLLIDSEKKLYLKTSSIPVKKTGSILTVATANPSPESFAFIKEHWGNNTEIVCTSKYDVLFTLQKHFSDEYLDFSINDLINTQASLSSKYTLSRWQLLFLFFSATLAVYYASNRPMQFFIGLNIFFMVSIVGIIFYKIVLSLLSYAVTLRKEKLPPDPLLDDNLPIYSILIPLYKEKEITLRNLFISLKKIDYPQHLLDIKILLEQDDTETIAIVKKLRLPSYFEFIYVPQGFPRTKAKACNYGLHFVRGEYITLYDAEDEPAPLQLRIALQAFKKYETERLACVQSHLNFSNIHENWLTKMFTIEYTYWFDLLLPALEYLRTPIPLGGTSNHFKTAALLELHAWDPYNVTEDADIGIRLERMGYSSRVITSTTYEEANCHLGNWIKQRTRWIKGYIQTYIVHMRNPFLLWHSLGTGGFIGFQLFVGGTILTNLANLPLWILYGITWLPEFFNFSFHYPAKVLPLAQANFIIGSVGIIILNLLGVARRKQYKLFWVALTSPLYWLLMSAASYRSLFQLIFSPSVWEKTEHGISKTLTVTTSNSEFAEKTMKISQFFSQHKIKFGTSGIRALNSALTDKVCYTCTRAFLQYVAQSKAQTQNKLIAIAGDLRSNTDRIIYAISQAIAHKAYQGVYLGKIPTPALAYYCEQLQCSGVMVTGSHIDANMNGIKFYLPSGEILKNDEEKILTLNVDTSENIFNVDESIFNSMNNIPHIAPEGLQLYTERYLSFFPKQGLNGMRIGVYQHSSVAANLLIELLKTLGATVTPFGKSGDFHSLDTEALSTFDISLAKEKTSELKLDVIVTTDSDGDRSLIADEYGNWLRGDTVGMLCAIILEADYVVLPITCNSSIDHLSNFKEIIRTKVGSPYVIEEMNRLVAQNKKRVIGYEANGGVLLGTSFKKNGHTLAALPTRDSILPLLCLLYHINENHIPLSDFAKRYLCKFTTSSSIKNFSLIPFQQPGQIMLNKIDYSHLIKLFSHQSLQLIDIDYTDGIRMYFKNGDIIHLRPSGNSPELRCYTESNTEENALRLNQKCKKLLTQLHEKITETI